MASLDSIHLRLTGRVELRRSDGVVASLPTRRTVLLLAMLALPEGEWLSRDSLAAAVWGGVELRAARDSLRTALSALRRILPRGAVRTLDDDVALSHGAVNVEIGEGEFMPGYESDWAVEWRLRLRTQAVTEALVVSRAAQAGGRFDDALALAERATSIDPLDTSAAAWRGELLIQAGRRAEALTLGSIHRGRVIRELGYLPDLEARAEPRVENPMVSAVEWALERDPEQACAMLAATQAQWLTSSVGPALDLHRRVLAAASRPSSERRLAEAGAWYLTVTAAGPILDLPKVAESYRNALSVGEAAAAGRLCEALAYAHLSRGDFQTAISYGEEGVCAARVRGDRLIVAQAEITLGIVETHVGHRESSLRRTDVAVAVVEELGSPLAVLVAHSIKIGTFIERGKLDRAVDTLESCRRAVAVHDSHRLRPWLLHLEGLIHEKVGDLAAARSAFERFRAEAGDAGQAATAIAEDSLMRVNCRLGEYGEAAEAWSRVVIYRRSKGSVPSQYERQLARPVLRELRDRFGARQTRSRPDSPESRALWQ